MLSMGELHGCDLVALAYEIKHGVIRRLYCAIDLVHVRDQRLASTSLELISAIEA